jgi:hypothetical protein
MTPDEELPSENNRFTELGKVASEGLRSCQKVGNIVEQECGPMVGVGEALTMARAARKKVSQKSMISVVVGHWYVLRMENSGRKVPEGIFKVLIAPTIKQKYFKLPPKHSKWNVPRPYLLRAFGRT